MCEFLIDDFSLADVLTDAHMDTLGSGSGFDLGNPTPVHRVVDSFLLNDAITHTDDWGGREIVIPVRVHGPTLAALGDMASRLHLALRRPRVLTLLPCDDWGAPTQWRIQHARLDATTDDFGQVSADPYHDYKITLGVSAWSHSVEEFSAIADPNITPDIIWQISDGVTGWVANGGTLANSVGNYVGLTSTTDEPWLSNNSVISYDPAAYNTVTVEWSTSAGSVQPVLYPVAASAPPTKKLSGTRVSRVNLGSGWYADTFLIEPGSEPATALTVRAGGLIGAGYDFRIRKVTLSAGTIPGPVQDLWLDVPGSAPAAEAAITLTGDVQGGLLFYTLPNLPETTEMPVVLHGTLASSVWTSTLLPSPNAAGEVWPEGNYHLLMSFTTTGVVDAINWEVRGQTHAGSNVIQSGTVATADMPTGATLGDRFVTIANNIYLPAQSLPTGELSEANIRITETGAGSISAVRRVLLVWMGNPLTGENSPAYTNLIPTGSGGPAWTVVRAQQPTAERPIPSLLVGIDEDSLYQESRAVLAFGHHQTPPGLFRVMAIQASTGAAAEVAIEWSGKPGWHTWAVPPSRWRQTP